MSTQELSGSWFGRRVKVEYSQTWITYALLGLRLVIGWTFVQAGLSKVLDPAWTASGFLQFAIPESNPFLGLWTSFAGSPLIDILNSWGQLLVGLGLMLGALVRWNAFWAAVMMIFYWMTSLQGGLGQFLPLEHGWVVDDHIVYAVLLFALGALGAGRIFGLDAIIERTKFVKRNGWLKVFLG